MIKEIEIDKVKLRLFDDAGVIHPYLIENSPHYKLLCGDKDSYQKYYDRMKMLGRAKNNYMNSDEYLNFYENFNYLEEPYEDSYITVKLIDGSLFTVDGDHRIVSEYKKGSTKVLVDIVDTTVKWIGYSNLLNISEILDGVDDYVIIKDDDDIPNYRSRDDLDILCKDRNKLKDIILPRLKPYQEKNFTIKVVDKGIRTHIDVYPPNSSSLNFRFDLLDSFPYRINSNIDVNNSYFDVIFERSISESFDVPFTFKEGKVDLSFPNTDDDLVLRFLEWVWRPDKVRHVKYVKDNLTNVQSFIDILKKYTNVESDSSYFVKLFKDIDTKGI